MEKGIFKRKLRVIVLSFIFVLLICGSVYAADVAYIYKSQSKIDSNVLGIFSSLGLTVDYISEESLPKDLSDYKLVFIGDESLSDPFPIENYRTIIFSHYVDPDMGLTNRDGAILKSSSTDPLEVNLGGSDVQVYTSSKYTNGKFIPYYFLSKYDKACSVQAYAETSSDSTKSGDVIAFVDKGHVLSNGKTAIGNICFFGIVESDYWTSDAEDMFKGCIDHVLADIETNTNQSIICSNNSDCNDGNESTVDSCSNPGTSGSVCLHTPSTPAPQNDSMRNISKVSLTVSAVPSETSVVVSYSVKSGNASLVSGYSLSLDRTKWLWNKGSSYTFSGLNSSTNYTFYVKALDKSNVSSGEFSVLATTLSSAPAPNPEPVVSSGGGGGGGGGGNGLCITQWSCTAWGECKNSLQTRVCTYPEHYCYPTAPKPIETQSCKEEAKPVSTEATTPIQETNETVAGRAGITGGVIGVLGKYSLWFVIGFLVLIAIIYLIVRMRK